MDGQVAVIFECLPGMRNGCERYSSWEPIQDAEGSEKWIISRFGAIEIICECCLNNVEMSRPYMEE